MLVWVVKATPRSLFAQERDPVPIVQEGRWASGPVWAGAENLAPTWVQTPNRPACRQSLYQLRYACRHRAFIPYLIYICICSFSLHILIYLGIFTVYVSLMMTTYIDRNMLEVLLSDIYMWYVYRMFFFFTCIKINSFYLPKHNKSQKLYTPRVLSQSS
jgi:hypothetical protein